MGEARGRRGVRARKTTRTIKDEVERVDSLTDVPGKKLGRETIALPGYDEGLRLRVRTGLAGNWRERVGRARLSCDTEDWAGSSVSRKPGAAACPSHLVLVLACPCLSLSGCCKCSTCKCLQEHTQSAHPTRTRKWPISGPNIASSDHLI